MKKYISVIVLGFMLAAAFNQAQGAATWTSSECNTEKGGEIVEVGGDSFCKSTSTMNWWSAYSWCQGMGGRMPSIAELCPGKEIVDRNPCGRQYVLSPPDTDIWSSTPYSGNYMWTVWLKTDQIRRPLTRVDGRYVFCLHK